MKKGADRDPVIAEGLAHRIKYVRLVRRIVKGRLQWVAQLVCEGIPLRKLDPKTGQVRHPYGSEVQGLDSGPSTIALVGETQAALQQFAAEVVRCPAEIGRLQRHIDRQRRANNPECYEGIFAHPAKKVKLAQVVVAPILHSLFPECRIRESRRQSIKVYRCLFRAELKFTD